MTPDQPQGKKRKLLGFYITAFVLLGLAVSGVLFYEPLVLGYAMYKVEKTGGIIRGGGLPTADKWLVQCMEAACRGSKPAMRVVVRKAHVQWHLQVEDRHEYVSFCPVSSEAARAQPLLFCEVLDEHSDQRALEVMWWAVTESDGTGDETAPEGPTASRLAKTMKVHLQLRVKDEKSTRIFLEYLSRRFNLTESAKASR